MIEMVYSNPYVVFAATLVGSIILAKVVYFILDKWVRALTKKTKTDLDDAILDNIEGPVYLIIILIGAYYAVSILPFIGPYMDYVKNTAFVAAVFSFTWVLQRLTGVMVPRFLLVHRSFEKTPRLVSRILSGAFYFIALIMVLGYFKVEITPLITTLGIGGIAVGLAMQDTLSNFFAGVHIVSDKPIVIGDFIEIEATVGGAHLSGYVEDIGWRSTKIRTLPGSIVVVPNAKLAQSVIVNHALPMNKTNFVVQCGVSYSSDLAKVEKIAVEAATWVQKNVKGAVKEFEPFIRFHTFGDSNIDFSIIMQADTYVDKYLITHELVKEIKRRFDKAKIEINYPVRKVINARR